MDFLTNPIVLTNEVTILVGLIRLSATFVLVLALAIIYKRLNRGKEDCYIMMHSMIYIGVILSGAMMVIGTNLVVAFGLLGAVSIIRFRTVVDNPIDMSFLFLAIVVGISCGLGLFSHAFLLTLFIGFLILFLNRFRVGMTPPSHFTYRISIRARKESLSAPAIKLLREELGKDATLIEVGTTSKSIRVRFLKPLKGIIEIDKVHRDIEKIITSDKTLSIQVIKK